MPKPTAREKREWVQEKLQGFELRQAAREQRRKELIANRARAEAQHRERVKVLRFPNAWRAVAQGPRFPEPPEAA